MKVLISPDKFKGSLSASEVCDVIGSVLSQHNIEVVKHPLADGGDGSLAMLETYLNLKRKKVDTVDPLGRPITAHYLYSSDEVFIELASASGYVLLDSNEKNPLITSTRGTGVMIHDAIKSAYKKINLFLGGSATNDAGMGILHELGFRFLDKKDDLLFPTGENLIRLDRIAFEGKSVLDDISFNLICDVNNPLYGPYGAAEVYARQKGASEDDVKKLNTGLENFANCIFKHRGIDVQDISGAGAAGGVPGGLIPLLNAKIKFGARHFMDITHYKNHLNGVNAIITGEGCLDGQSFNGKVVDYVKGFANNNKIPLFYFVGMCKYDEVPELKKDHIFAITDVAKDSFDAMDNAAIHLRHLTNRFIEVLEKLQKGNR